MKREIGFLLTIAMLAIGWSSCNKDKLAEEYVFVEAYIITNTYTNYSEWECDESTEDAFLNELLEATPGVSIDEVNSYPHKLVYIAKFYCVRYDNEFPDLTETTSGTNMDVVPAGIILNLKEDGSYTLSTSVSSGFAEQAFEFNYSVPAWGESPINILFWMPMTCWQGFSNTLYPDVEKPGTEGVYEKLGDGSILIDGMDVIYGEDFLDYSTRQWYIHIEPR